MNELLRRRALLMNQGFEVEWNQLVPILEIPSVTEVGVTFTNLENGGILLSGTATSVGGFLLLNLFHSEINHKYLIRGCPERPRTSYIQIYNGYPFFTNGDYGTGVIFTNPVDTWDFMRIRVSAGIDYTGLVFTPQLFDLTQMFGAGNEPSTNEQFDAWLQENGINPNDYFPYDTGTLRRMTKPSWII